jgi:hypothetical protein
MIFLKVRYTIEGLTVLFALAALIDIFIEFKIENYKFCYKFNLLVALSPTKILFLFACLSILFIVPFRFACNYSVEDIVAILVLIFMSTHFLHFLRLI